MKKFTALIIVVLALLLPVSGYAMGDNPKVDPECLSSETLRVEIGREKFAFPRKIVRVVDGSDVVNTEDPKGKSAGPKKACQRANDPIWLINYVSLDLYPKPCGDNRECNLTRIDVYIDDRETRPVHEDSSTISITKPELLKKCTPPREPYNAQHAKYWSACDYAFQDKNLHIWIKFKGGNGMYPPEDIENTKATVLRMIRHYRID